MRYLRFFLVAVDVLVNIILCAMSALVRRDASMLRSSWNETLSARAWRMEAAGKPYGGLWRPVIDALFFWQPGHCHAQWLRESAAGGVWKSFNSPSA
jgi:hypothetical protein